MKFLKVPKENDLFHPRPHSQSSEDCTIPKSEAVDTKSSRGYSMVGSHKTERKPAQAGVQFCWPGLEAAEVGRAGRAGRRRPGPCSQVAIT